MAGDRDQIDLIQELAELTGRPVGTEEADLVLDRTHRLTAQRANEIWSQHHRAPATVSMRDYLAMTLKFIGQDPPT